MVWMHDPKLRRKFRSVHPIWGVFAKSAYFSDKNEHHLVMTTTVARDTSCVIETQWERLFRLVERRRKVVGLTQAGIQVAGGPSDRTIQKLRKREGLPTDRERTTLRKLDAALHWPAGTSYGLVAEDRSSWSEALLTDEEEQLMEHVDEADELAYVVATRLRAIPRGPERDAAMRRVLAALDVTP